jgi:hypothetical protein
MMNRDAKKLILSIGTGVDMNQPAWRELSQQFPTLAESNLPRYSSVVFFDPLYKLSLLYILGHACTETKKTQFSQPL